MTNPNTYRVIAKRQNPSKSYRMVPGFTWPQVDIVGTCEQACRIATRHSKRNPDIEYRVMVEKMRWSYGQRITACLRVVAFRAGFELSR